MLLRCKLFRLSVPTNCALIWYVASELEIILVDFCLLQDDCSDYLKEILTASLDNGFYDIAFNFVIGNFGVFECRGWSARPDVFLVPSFTDYEIIKQNFINIAVIASDFDDYFNQTAFDVLKNGALMGKVAKYIGFKCDDNLKAFCPNETVNVYA